MIDFSARYRQMTPEQLMQVAQEGQLQPEAAESLAAEMSVRGISKSQVEEYARDARHQQLQLQHQEKSLSATRGIMIAFRNPHFLSSEDKAHKVECRTRWFSMAWIPLVPLGSFRVRANPPGAASRYEILSKEKLDWTSVIRVWLSEIAAVFLLILVLHLLDRR